MAAYLKHSHGATQVILFGSSSLDYYLPGHSDIDLYFAGIPFEKEFAVALSALSAFPKLKLDLVPSGHARAEILAEVRQFGIEL